MLLFGIQGNYSLKYYPNSRTSYSGNTGFIYTNGIGKELNQPNTDVEYKNFHVDLRLNAQYYFSPQVSVNGSLGLNYSNTYNTTIQYINTQYPVSNNLSASISLELIYKLF